MEADRVGVARCGDGTQLRAALFAGVVSEPLVELASQTATALVWPDAYEVHVSQVRLEGETKATKNPAKPCSSSTMRLVDQKWSRKSRGSEGLTDRPHQLFITATMLS